MAQNRDGQMSVAAAVRLDVWLWAARFFKTRALAKRAIEAGKIELDGQSTKPATTVHVGRRMKISRGEERFEIDVRDLSEKRGAASIAQQLYAETEASRLARAEAVEQRRLNASGYSKPPTKPDKRARRLIHALGDIDAM